MQNSFGEDPCAEVMAFGKLWLCVLLRKFEEMHKRGDVCLCVISGAKHSSNRLRRLEMCVWGQRDALAMHLGSKAVCQGMWVTALHAQLVWDVV